MKKVLFVIFCLSIFLVSDIAVAQTEEPVCCILMATTYGLNGCGGLTYKNCKAGIGLDYIYIKNESNYYAALDLEERAKYFAELEKEELFPAGCRLKESKPCRNIWYSDIGDDFYGAFDMVGLTSADNDTLDYYLFEDEVLCSSPSKTSGLYMSNVCSDIFNLWKKKEGIDSCHNKLDRPSCVSGKGCFWSNSQSTCFETYLSSDCPKIMSEFDCSVSKVCKWDFDTKKCLDQYQSYLKNVYGDKSAGKFMPACAIYGSCNSIADIIEVPIKFAQEMFKYVGALAFVFFIVGGVIMVLSFGNAEKFAQGKRVLVAAVVGLVIVFAAYFIIDFILDTLNVGGDFKPN